jgi:uncharacterized protein YciI
MPLFVVAGLDHPPHAMERRDAVRTPHRAYVKTHDRQIRLAAAMLTEDGDQCGSLYLFEAESEAEIRDWLAQEPFVNGDVYREIIVRRLHLAHNLLDRIDWRDAPATAAGA